MAVTSRTLIQACVLAGCCALLVAGVHAAPNEPPAGEPAPLRELSSKHLLLVTDLAPSSEVDAYPQVFDQAFPQWCEYFGIDPTQHADWRARCYLMKSRERFKAAGLLPEVLPEFKSGYTRGDQIWLLDQPGDYYRRHMLLHEGTHAFMYSLVGSACPPWYFEGVAELLATHRSADGKLTLNVFPQSREDVPLLGRIDVVRRAYAARRAQSLPRIFALDQRAHMQNDPYAWCWAAAALFDGHPRYQKQFREMARVADKDDFAQRWQAALGDNASRLDEDWQLFVANLDYGYDFARMDFEAAPGAPLDAAGAKVTMQADRGWQPSGVQLTAGKKYRLRATGSYEVGQDPRPWRCEPGGVTIRYHQGQPLGILLAAIRDDKPSKASSGLIKPLVIGTGATITPQISGTLYLRVNESAGQLSDNAGTLEVEVSQAGAD